MTTTADAPLMELAFCLHCPVNLLRRLADATPAYPANMQAARRAAFRALVEAKQADTNGLWDGSDTSMSAQLDDAGFGSGGVL